MNKTPGKTYLMLYTAYYTDVDAGRASLNLIADQANRGHNSRVLTMQTFMKEPKKELWVRAIIVAHGCELDFLARYVMTPNNVFQMWWGTILPQESTESVIRGNFNRHKAWGHTITAFYDWRRNIGWPMREHSEESEDGDIPETESEEEEGEENEIEETNEIASVETTTDENTPLKAKRSKTEATLIVDVRDEEAANTLTTSAYKPFCTKCNVTAQAAGGRGGRMTWICGKCLKEF